MEDFRMKVFEAVYESGSFTKAAGVLGISQPAVSQNISELEKSAGCSLFARAGGRVSVTPQGEIFHRFARKVNSAYHDMDAVFCTKLPAGSSFRIYADPPARHYLMHDVLSSLGILYPDCGFVLSDKQEGADICIMSTPSCQSGCLVSSFYVLPPDHFLSKVIRPMISSILE